MSSDTGGQEPNDETTEVLNPLTSESTESKKKETKKKETKKKETKKKETKKKETKKKETKRISKTITIDVDSDNIGAFIGRDGDNFKKMIASMKKKIINKKVEITPEEWNSVTINLKFEKSEENVNAIFECDEDHVDIIEKILNDFVKLHKEENIKFEKKRSQGTVIVYRIGAEHRFIGRMIGVSGSNVDSLKNDLKSLPSVDYVSRINIEEQTKRYNGKFRNIGERGAPEHILMFITIKGTPIFENVEAIVVDFVKKYAVDEDKDEDEDENEDEDDEFNGSW